MASDLRSRFLTGLLVVSCCALSPAVGQRARYTIYGQVRMPDGKPAPRVIVQVDSAGGLNMQAYTNDQGQYELNDLPSGRYRVTASDPGDPTLVIEPAEVEPSRVSGLRVLANLFFRYPATTEQTPKQPTVSVPEMEQKIPKDARKEYEKAVKQKAKGDVEHASKTFTRAIELFPDYFQALAARGELLIVSGHSADALPDFERALKINPHYAPALQGSGFCKMEQRRFQDAAADLEKAVSLDPANSQAQLFLGISSLALGRHDAARLSLREALKLDPSAASAHVYLANLHALEGHYLAAADEIHTYLIARPAAPNAEKLRAQEADWRQRASVER